MSLREDQMPSVLKHHTACELDVLRLVEQNLRWCMPFPLYPDKAARAIYDTVCCYIRKVSLRKEYDLYRFPWFDPFWRDFLTGFNAALDGPQDFFLIWLLWILHNQVIYVD